MFLFFSLFVSCCTWLYQILRRHADKKFTTPCAMLSKQQQPDTDQNSHNNIALLLLSSPIQHHPLVSDENGSSNKINCDSIDNNPTTNNTILKNMNNLSPTSPHHLKQQRSKEGVVIVCSLGSSIVS
jgi:hypothetical protein